MLFRGVTVNYHSSCKILPHRDEVTFSLILAEKKIFLNPRMSKSENEFGVHFGGINEVGGDGCGSDGGGGSGSGGGVGGGGCGGG